MTRKALGLALLITSAAVISCNNPSSDYIDSEKHGQTDGSESGLDTQLSPAGGGLPDFEVQYIGGNYLANDSGLFPSETVIKVVSSKTELELGFDVNRRNCSSCLGGAIEKYTDDFFANNFLVVASFSASSGSFRHRVEKIDADGNISINVLKPEEFTDDMAAWTVIIPLNGDSKQEKYSVVFNDVHIPPVDPPTREPEPKDSILVVCPDGLGEYPCDTIVPTHIPRVPIKFDVQYIRTGSYGRPAQNPVVIRSRAELEEYDLTLPVHIYDSDGVGSNGFTDKITEYTDGFFKTRYLVIVQQVEPSGSIRHQVEKIDENGNIYITRLLPEFGTDDIGSWHIVIPLTNDYDLKEYNVVFTDKSAY